MPASTAIRQDLHAVRRAAGLAGAPRPMGPEDTDGHASFWAAFDAPEPPNPEEKGKPKPREARKSFRWVEGLRDCADVADLADQRSDCDAVDLEDVLRRVELNDLSVRGCGSPVAARRGVRSTSSTASG